MPASEPDTLRGAVPLAGITLSPSASMQSARESNINVRTIGSRMAALTVRRMCNQHLCSGAGCTHPNHQRDVKFLTSMLEHLGLPGEFREVSAEERKLLVDSLALDAIDPIITGVSPEGGSDHE